MEEELSSFAEFLRVDRHMAHNTLVSYERDLRQFMEWLAAEEIDSLDQITDTLLETYVQWLGKQGRATTTVSRVVASMKAFFSYETQAGMLEKDPSEHLHAPKVEKRAPTVLTAAEVSRLIEQTKGDSLKKLRDRAMLELLCATGLRVSEIILLKVSDLDFSIGSVKCRNGARVREIPFGKETEAALRRYLDEGRAQLLKDGDNGLLFVNISGQPMSRQGFWKIIKYYGEKAGIRSDITPQVLRNSFAAHLLESGADMNSMQAMLGHSDPSVTHAFVSYLNAGGGSGEGRRTERRRASRNGV